MKKIINLFFILLPIGMVAQSYTDYIGAGNSAGVTITASDSRATSPAENTLNGKGMDSRYFAVGRFLSHASLGPTPEMIQDLLDTDNDFGAWIDNEFTKPMSVLTPEMEQIWEEIFDFRVEQGEDPDDIFGPWKPQFDYSWWQTTMTNDDHLRQKVAYALSQVLVISDNSDLRDWAEALTGYYDILLEHSFGNYRDLLEDVTYSVQMGYFLSHLNNAKENPEANTSPDENYAREIMQLFSIGLYELNIDGTRVLDGNGDPIPTYDQNDIQEYAKVFTGFGIGELENPDNWPYTPFFGLGVWAAKKDSPMVIYNDFHETEEKTLLGGQVIPANQTGEQDIDDALDNLFNHPNVGPFLSTLLIKRLVKSNPSPAYVERVAMAFNDNGNGVRGDMKAVVKAILMDEEARSGQAMLADDAGRAREPMMKFSAFAKAMPKIITDNKYWAINFSWRDNTGQSVLSSPTVFNYYLPNFQPVGDLTNADLSAPELKLHNTSSSINYINEIYTWCYWGEEDWMDGMPTFTYTWEDNSVGPPMRLDQNYFLQFADDPELLINELDRRLTYGQLSDETRDIIIPVLHDTYWTWNDTWRINRVKSAIYYMMISPDFNIMK